MAENYDWLPQIDTKSLFALGQSLAGGRRPEPKWAVNPITGEYYNINAAEVPSQAQGLIDINPAAANPATAGMSPRARLAFEVEAAKQKARPKQPPAQIMRQYNEATKDVTSINNTLKLLEEAQDLLGKDEKGIYEGITGPAQTIASTKLNPGGALEQGEDWVNKTLGTNFDFVNKGKGVSTSRFQQIMEAESLKTLSRELKGPTAVQEVMTYKKIVADDTKTNAERAMALKGMMDVIRNDLAAQGKIIGNIERAYPSIAPGAGTAPDDAAPDSPADPEQLRVWAQEAIDQGADPEQVQQMLMEYGVE